MESCISCKYADDNYHEWKLYCVMHEFYLSEYDVCDDYEEPS